MTIGIIVCRWLGHVISRLIAPMHMNKYCRPTQPPKHVQPYAPHAHAMETTLTSSMSPPSVYPTILTFCTCILPTFSIFSSFFLGGGGKGQFVTFLKILLFIFGKNDEG